MTTIVWFRSDLRVHDNPALTEAIAVSKHVMPVFVLDKHILHNHNASANRVRFLLESLQDLRQSLHNLGADLVIRRGEPATELNKLAKEYGASAVFYANDYTPYARKRDDQVNHELQKCAVTMRPFPGRLLLDSTKHIRTGGGSPYKVFTPFWRACNNLARRSVLPKPPAFKLPPTTVVGAIPLLEEISPGGPVSPHALKGGETHARQRLQSFLKSDVHRYHEQHDDMAADATSRLSSYIHFGCISPREIEDSLAESAGEQAFGRQLVWRDFYNYVLYHFPQNTKQEFQERYRSLVWDHNTHHLTAWQQGKTGYPIVDAAMRQLNSEGWMHNRARLIVGSFLTKDLGIDWRYGEAYFMKMLIDGDTANNNGNWQWIASVGVDPAPLFRRLYNPTSQQKNYDPSGMYVRRYVPELAKVNDKNILEPSAMTIDAQNESQCIIGIQYPAPIVNHAVARAATIERYKHAR